MKRSSNGTFGQFSNCSKLLEQTVVVRLKISRIELVKTVEIISGWDSSPSIHFLSISFDMMWQFIWNQVDWFDRSKANGTKVDGLGFTVHSLDQNNLLLMIDRPENESGWGKVIWIPIRSDLERWFWRKKLTRIFGLYYQLNDDCKYSNEHA